MKIRFKNARILKMTGEDIFIGDLVVEDKKIAYIGSDSDKFAPFDREIDCNLNLLMPGFKNSHTHCCMNFLRSHADDLPLNDWLFKKVFPYEAGLEEGDVYYLTKMGFCECLTSGITTVFDMYYNKLEIAQAAKDIGMRAVIMGSPRDAAEDPNDIREHFIILNKYDELVTCLVGFHAEYTTSEKVLGYVKRTLDEFKAPMYCHADETASEVQGCIERHGSTPLKYLADFGCYDYGGGAYHCVHVSDDDFKVIVDKKLNVVTCPASNSKLASGICDLNRFLEAGVNVGIGTDGPASNNSMDMFKEMYLAATLSKIAKKDAAIIDANEVLKMATVNGAKLMNLPDCDVLEVGKYADMIMYNMHLPNTQPIHNITKNIVYAGSKQNIMMTMINGKILYENGEFFVGEDIEELYKKCDEITRKLINKVDKN